jgi:lysophospholipase
MDFFSNGGYPVPPDPVAGSIFTDDGIRLRFAYWRASGAKRLGTVYLMQGRAECIEKYFEVVSELRERGFAVATLDWRGQGGSDRALNDSRKGHVDDFAEYDADLDAYMQQIVLPDLPPPYYVLAHSMGGMIALRAARSMRTRFTRMVLSAPLVDIAVSSTPRAVSHIVPAIATALGLGDLRVPGQEQYAPDLCPFPGNFLTSDPARYQRYVSILKERPAHAIGAPSFAWLHAANRAMREMMLQEFGDSVQVPVLLVAAGDDRVVSTTAIARLARELRAGAYVVIPGARHELLMERNSLRELFWAAFDAFIPGSAVLTS